MPVGQLEGYNPTLWLDRFPWDFRAVLYFSIFPDIEKMGQLLPMVPFRELCFPIFSSFESTFNTAVKSLKPKNP